MCSSVIFFEDKVNNYNVFNKEHLVKEIFDRPPGKPLLTVCNHMSCVDDPAILAG